MEKLTWIMFLASGALIWRGSFLFLFLIQCIWIVQENGNLNMGSLVLCTRSFLLIIWFLRDYALSYINNYMLNCLRKWQSKFCSLVLCTRSFLLIIWFLRHYALSYSNKYNILVLYWNCFCRFTIPSP